jgi:ABC-type Fe3+-siderophore transport system permease subunit
MTGIVHFFGFVPPHATLELKPVPADKQALLASALPGAVELIDKDGVCSVRNLKPYPIPITVLLAPKAAVQMATLPWKQIAEDFTAGWSDKNKDVVEKASKKKAPKKGQA